MKQTKRISAVLFVGMGISLICNGAVAYETDQAPDLQHPQLTLERPAGSESAPPPPGPFRAPLPGAPQGPDQMFPRMDREPPSHARPSRPEFHRGPLHSGADRMRPDTPVGDRPPFSQAPQREGGEWHPPTRATTYQRGTPPTPPTPPWARGDDETPQPPGAESTTQPAVTAPGESAAAPAVQAPTWAEARRPPGFSRPTPKSRPQPPAWHRSHQQDRPGPDQARSPWAPSGEETGQTQQPSGYPQAAYMPPNFPPPPPATQQPYFYPGQGYSAPTAGSSPQPGAVPGYYGPAPWSGPGYSRFYPAPYPYGPRPGNW
jgi:hypothetical protein